MEYENNNFRYFLRMIKPVMILPTRVPNIAVPTTSVSNLSIKSVPPPLPNTQ
jgi:hypothetical protein